MPLDAAVPAAQWLTAAIRAIPDPSTQTGLQALRRATRMLRDLEAPGGRRTSVVTPCQEALAQQVLRASMECLDIPAGWTPALDVVVDHLDYLGNGTLEAAVGERRAAIAAWAARATGRDVIRALRRFRSMTFVTQVALGFVPRSLDEMRAVLPRLGYHAVYVLQRPETDRALLDAFEQWLSAESPTSVQGTRISPAAHAALLTALDHARYRREPQSGPRSDPPKAP